MFQISNILIYIYITSFGTGTFKRWCEGYKNFQNQLYRQNVSNESSDVYII